MVEQKSIHIEEWRPIPGYGGVYSASTHGQIRRESNVGKRHRPQRILKQSKHNSRCGNTGTTYRVLGLSYESKTRHWLVHRLVALTFIGPCPLGYQCNHKNGVKHDNRPENLEYVTPRDNQLHKHAVLGYVAVRPHTVYRGTQHHHSKFTEDDIRQMRALYATGTMRQKDIAAQFGTVQTVVGKIVRREAWLHIA